VKLEQLSVEKAAALCSLKKDVEWLSEGVMRAIGRLYDQAKAEIEIRYKEQEHRYSKLLERASCSSHYCSFRELKQIE
jgi:hypothetical protein